MAFGAALTISDLVASRSAFAETGSPTAWSWRGKKGLVNLRRREATRDDKGALQPLPSCIGTGRLLDETERSRSAAYPPPLLAMVEASPISALSAASIIRYDASTAITRDPASAIEPFWPTRSISAHCSESS